MEKDIINTAGLNNQDFVRLMKKMWEIRSFEETLQELYEAGHLYGTMHLCIGQEATAAGGAGILRKEDWITSTHRNHGHCIAKGTDLRAMMAEMLGKRTGTNHGKGGSMHIADLSVGNLGSNGIVGAGFPIAAGAALTAQMQGSDQVALCYAGDGATNEGSFHEALNLASIWHLPVVYFIENNLYGMSSSIEQMTNVAQLADRGMSYGIEGIKIDGNDLVAVVNTVDYAVKKAQRGEGPTLIEAITYRHAGHSKSDKLLYRTEAEELKWKRENDPIDRTEALLLDHGVLTPEQIATLKGNIQTEIQAVVQSVQQDPEPSVEELWGDVYA